MVYRNVKGIYNKQLYNTSNKKEEQCYCSEGDFQMNEYDDIKVKKIEIFLKWNIMIINTSNSFSKFTLLVEINGPPVS